MLLMISCTFLTMFTFEPKSYNMYCMHPKSNKPQKPCIQAVIALYGACTRSCDISETPEVTCKVATQVATVMRDTRDTGLPGDVR
jgi:hypothetical protein